MKDDVKEMDRIIEDNIRFGNMLSDCKDVIRLKDVVIRNYLKNER